MEKREKPIQFYAGLIISVGSAILSFTNLIPNTAMIIFFNNWDKFNLYL